MSIYSKKYLIALLIAAIILIGVLFRTYVYLQNVSFWADESALILNLMSKTYLELFKPLDYNQQAPPLFLIFSKMVYQLFGLNEFILRSIPYFSSLISLVLFYFVCKKFFTHHISILIALLLFALHFRLINYAQMFKPYSSDVCFSIILLLLFLGIDFKNITTKKIALLSVLCILLPWISYSSIFYTIPYCLCMFFYSCILKNKKLVKYSSSFLVVNLTGFCIYYFINLYYPANSEYQHQTWGSWYGFLPDTYARITALFNYIFSVKNEFGLFLTSLILLIGVYKLIKHNKTSAIIILMPILATAAAGFFHLYPFADRLILFLIPNFILIFVSAIEYTNITKKTYNYPLIILLFTSYLFISGVFKYPFEFYTKKSDFDKSSTREYIRWLKDENVSMNSVVYFNASDGGYEIYADKFNFKCPEKIFEVWPNIIESMEMLPHNKIVYIHAYNKYDDPNMVYDYKTKINWINKNCTILKKRELYNRVFIKCHRM